MLTDTLKYDNIKIRGGNSYMDIKEVLNLKNGSVVKFTLNEREHILEVWDGELFIQSTGVLATDLFLLKTLIDIEYELIKEGDCYD